MLLFTERENTMLKGKKSLFDLNIMLFFPTCKEKSKSQTDVGRVSNDHVMTSIMKCVSEKLLHAQ